MAAELFGALGSLHSAQLPPSRPPPLDSPLPVIANYFSDNPHSARSFLGYLFLLSAVNNAEVTKVEWLLLSFGVDPNRRPGAGEQIELREGRVSLKGLAGESLAWAIEEGCTPLMLAARSPHSSAPAIIKLLLKNGANPSLPDFHSWTALLRASWNGREPNVSVLLTGVDGRVSNVNERDRGGWTAIMRAAWNAHIPTLRLLLLHHAPLNATDRYGQTALILAASLGHTEVVRVLLEAGADPEKRDGKGQAPLAVAENFKHVEAAKLLREWIQARSEGVSATFATAEQGDKGKEKVTGPFALDTSNTRQVSSIFADQLTHEEIFGLPTPRQLSVPGAYGDPDPEPEETVPLEPEIPVPEPSMIEPDVPQPVPYAHLLPDGVSIAPSNENAIHPDLSSRLAIALERLASPPPSESALLSNFAELNDHASAEKGVREGVVKRMESIRFLREGIANFVSFAEKRGALVAELGLLGREAKEGVEDRAKEMQKIEETFSELDKERKATQDAMNAVATNLAGLQLSIGLPNEASGIVTEARAKVDATFDERAVGLEADKLRTEREQAGFEQAREAADACAQFAREQVGRAQASRASLEVVLKGAEQEHAGYLRELVARSLRVLHSIRRGLEQANEEAEQAVAMGLQARHDRLRREYRGLEDELEEAKRLKTWYERCLSELDHTTAPVPSELPQLEIAPQGQVELAPSTATSASPVVPIPAHTESLAKEPGLPDAASHTESLEPVTQLGLRQLVVAETEFGTEAGDAVQMVDVELSHPPSLQEEPSTASSELDSDDASYSKIDRNELDELEVREEEVEEGKGRLLVD